MDEDLRKVISYIIDNNPSDEVSVTDYGNYEYEINGVEYYIISESETDNVVYEYYNNLLDYYMEEELAPYWQEYIDRTKWLDDNVVGFEDMLNAIYENVQYVGMKDGYIIYQLNQ